MDSSIFIEYETKTREFDGKLLLISHLLNSGFKNIHFGSAMPLRKEALLQNNGIYFFKSLSVNELSFYQKLKDRGFTLCLIHAEGGIYYKEISTSIESMFNKIALDFIDYNFVFGDEIKENIIKVNGVNFDKKSHVTGEPRFDLLKPKYQSFFNTEINNIKNIYGEFILINTSFSAANPKIGFEVLRNYWLNEPTSSEKAKELLMFKMEFFKKVLADYLIAIKTLSLKFPNLNFIVRPHPSESLQVYQNKFGKNKNVFVTNKDNVASWIMSSKGVIHYDCTTGIEALLANKPVISYTPILDKSIVAWLPIAVSNNISNIDKLESAVELISTNNYGNNKISDQYNQQLSNIISNFYQNSSPLLVDILNKNVPKKSFKNTLKRQVLRFKNRIYYNIRTILKKYYYKIKGINEVGMDKIGVFKKEEIEFKLNKINSIEKFNFKVSVKIHTQNSCVINIDN